jgi:hypothetical protein
LTAARPLRHAAEDSIHFVPRERAQRLRPTLPAGMKNSESIAARHDRPGDVPVIFLPVACVHRRDRVCVATMRVEC